MTINHHVLHIINLLYVVVVEYCSTLYCI